MKYIVINLADVLADKYLQRSVHIEDVWRCAMTRWTEQSWRSQVTIRRVRMSSVML